MADNIRIFYVEDDDDIRLITEFALQDEGFELISFSSGNQALENADNIKPDLLLLDVMMPGIDGPATLKQLRKKSEYETVPVLFMTAKVQPQEIEALKKLGILDVISKPFDPVTLADQIRDILNMY